MKNSLRSNMAAAHRFSIAPMMDWTDRHARYFLRLITREALLYTEMIPLGAILFGDRKRFLAFDPAEQPLALQVGGSDPAQLAEVARIVAGAGFCEINLNVGCPSPRVQKGRFGVCLMLEPELVAECVTAMARAVSIPVTVKARLGVDEADSQEALLRFVTLQRDAGCARLILHARKAWLKGLSPKENREIPPLDYGRAREVKAAFPDLPVIVNGGILDLAAAAHHLQSFDGVMLGRAAYQNPYLLAEVDRRFFGSKRPTPSRVEVVQTFLPYLERQLALGVPRHAMTRHLLGLFNGQPGAKAWRRALSKGPAYPGAGLEVLDVALAEVEEMSTAV
jgi:tRNA-dihydrouridine synthase A